MCIRDRSNSGGQEIDVHYKHHFRIENCPKFYGEIERYMVFKEAFQERMRADRVPDTLAATYLSCTTIMKDDKLQKNLEGHTYSEQWQLLDKRFASKILATQRAMRCLLPTSRRQLKLGKEFADFSLEVSSTFEYIERLSLIHI